MFIIAPFTISQITYKPQYLDTGKMDKQNDFFLQQKMELMSTANDRNKSQMSSAE